MFDAQYAAEKCYWGTEPDEALEEHIGLIPVGRALDLGVGEGRNALWLAGRGFDVEGIDSSEAAVRKFLDLAEQAGLTVQGTAADLRQFPIPLETYKLILSTATLHFLRPTDLWVVIDKIKQGLAPGGVAYLTAFTTDDPGFGRHRENGTPEVEPNTFWLERFNTPLHYFEPGELKRLFHDFELLHYVEERTLDTSHDEPHYHSGATLIARRPDGSLN